MTLLDAQVDTRTRHSLVTVFEQDLDRTRAACVDVPSEEVDIEVLGAKIYLYGLTFVNNQANDSGVPTSELPWLMKRDTLQRGFAAAIRLLHSARHIRLPGAATANPSDGHHSTPEYLYQLGFFPKHFFYTLFFANVFLLWFLSVDQQASPSDKELARNYVAASHRLFASYKNNGELIRSARLMELLGRMPSVAGRTVTGGPAASPTLRVNSRLGASFMYDAIYNASFYRQAMAQSSTSTATSNSSSGPPALSDAPGSRGPVQRPLPGAMTPRNSIAVPRISPMHPPTLGPSTATVAKMARNMSHDGGMAGVHVVDETGMSHALDTYGMIPDMAGQPSVDFPWGVWDNALYDDLNIGMDLSQIGYESQPYWG